MNLKQHKQKLLKTNPEFRREYYSYDLAFEIGQMILEARSIKGITQKRLAEMINTRQSGISRAESGKYLPSLSFLEKIAKVLKTYLIVRFGFMANTNAYNKAATLSTNKVYLNEEGMLQKSELFSKWNVISNHKKVDSHTYQY